MPTTRLPEPGAWWSLEDVTLRADGMLLYEPGPAVPTRVGGEWRSDERSRAAIEAFTALPLDALGDAIEERLARLRPRKRPMSDTWELPGGKALRDFLMTFGPLLGGYGARFVVANPRAETYEQRAHDAEFELGFWRDGKRPGRIRSQRRPRPWMVTFEGWAQGRHGSPPDVRELPADHGRDESLSRFRQIQTFVTTAVDLADALAVAAHWPSRREATERVRDLFLANGGAGFRLDGTTAWRRVIEGVPDAVDEVVLSKSGATEAGVDGSPAPQRWRVDWLLAGRMLLADMIGRHVQWAQLYLAVDETGRLGSEWVTRSLEEVMYIQLMEHVQREPRKRLIDLPYWPLPRCGYCDGVILGIDPRKPDGRFGNRWHRGRCRKAGQQRVARSALQTG